jgi:TolA-binding protein
MAWTKHPTLKRAHCRYPPRIPLAAVGCLWLLLLPAKLFGDADAVEPLEAASQKTKDAEQEEHPEKARDPVYEELLKINYVFNRELYDLALPRYEKLLEENPRYPRADLIHYALALCHYHLAMGHLAMGHVAAGRVAAGQVATKVPAPAGASPKAEGSAGGAAKSKKEHVQKAIAHLKEAIKRKDFESRLEATRLLGQCFLLSEDYEDAAKTFQWVMEKSPPEKEERAARLGLAEALYSQSKYTQAAEAYRQALKRAPEGEEKDRAEYYLAMTLFRERSDGSLSTAVKAFEKISARSSSRYAAEARYMLALAREAKGDDQGALEAFQSLAASGSPQAELGQLGLASACQRLGKHAQAAAEFNKFLQSFPDSDRKDLASLGLALSLLETGKASAGAKRLQELRSSPLAGDQACLSLARLYLDRQKASAAVAVLQSALKAFPASARREELELELVSALLASGDFKAAGEALSVFEKDHPQSSSLDQVAYLKAYSLHRAKKYEDSMAACAKFRETYPGSKLLKDTAQLEAENHFLAGRHEKAFQSYQRFLKEFEPGLTASEKLKARFRACQALYFAKKFEEAEKLFSALKEEPGSEASFREEPLFATYHYLLGDCAYQRKEYAKAREELSQFLKATAGQEGASPGEGTAVESSDARFKLAHSLQLEGDSEGAQTAYQEALKADPKTRHRDQIHFELGQIAYSQKKLKEAEEAFTQVIAGDLGSRFAPYALRYLGWMAFDRGNYAAAAERYKKLVEAFPDHELAPDAEIQLVLSLGSSNKPDEAREALRRFEERHPGDPRLKRVILQEAMALSKGKKPREALAILEKLRAEKVSGEILPSVLYEIAWCHRGLKDLDAAAKAYEDLLAEKEAGALRETASFELAELQFERKEYAKAKDLLEPLAAAKDLKGVQREKVLYRLIWCRHFLEQPDRALSEYEAFRKEFGSSNLLPELTLLAAKAYLKRGEPAKAGRVFLSIAESKPESEEAQVALVSYAECLAEEKKFEDSRERFGGFLERYPKSSVAYRARFGQAWAEENLGRLDEAMEKYKKVAKETTTIYGARAQFQLGQCLVSKKNLRDAIVEFLQVPAGYGYPEWSSKALLQVAGSFEAMGDRSNAKKYYKEVKATFPGRDEAKLAQERLTRLETE